MHIFCEPVKTTLLSLDLHTTQYVYPGVIFCLETMVIIKSEFHPCHPIISA
jgi:hypothetical protein